MNQWEAEEKKKLIKSIEGKDLKDLPEDRRKRFKRKWTEIEERANARPANELLRRRGDV